MSKPSKKDFTDLINQVAGQNIMTEQQLGKIISKAKKSFDKDGLTGTLDYLRDITGAQVTNDWMKNVMEQLTSTDGLKKVVDDFNIPLDVKRGRQTNKPRLSFKTGKPLRVKRKKSK